MVKWSHIFRRKINQFSSARLRGSRPFRKFRTFAPPRLLPCTGCLAVAGRCRGQARAMPRPTTPVWHDGRRRVHAPAGISTDSRRNVPHLGYGRSGFRALVVGMVLRLMGRPEGESAGLQAWRAVSAGQTPVRANILPLVRRNAGLWERGTRTQRTPDRTESDGI